MSPFDDLIADKGQPPLDKLTPLPADQLARLRESAVCEWQETLNDPAAQTRFTHFINSAQRDPNVQFVSERQQHRPARPDERIPVTVIADGEEV